MINIFECSFKTNNKKLIGLDKVKANDSREGYKLQII